MPLFALPALMGQNKAPQAQSPPAGEFRISLPTTWETQLDQYPGRLVTSYDPQVSARDLTAVRVGRLSLPALLRSARYNPREGDDKRGKWEEVALGGITPGAVAVWIMDAGQDAAARAAGIRSMSFNYNVSESRIEPLVD